MDELLKRARRGETVNEISGEGPLRFRGKGVISRMRLLNASLGSSPEAIELRALLKQNAEAAVGNGPPMSRWSYESIAMLRTGFEDGTNTKKLADEINTRFSRDFSVGAIYARAHKLGIMRRARILTPKPAKLPPLTAVRHFPMGSLLDRISVVVPRHLARDHRDDTIADMVEAVLNGRLAEYDIRKRAREFINSVYDVNMIRWEMSRSTHPIPGTDLLRINTVSEGLWG
jgi:hypothetical protein